MGNQEYIFWEVEVMNLGAASDAKNLKVVGTLRKTQLITTFGSGAIVDMPDYSVIIAATDYWSCRSPILHEPNLERMLGMEYFKEPLVTETEKENEKMDVPAFRFPVMHFCPGCDRLLPYKSFGDDSGKTCPECKNKKIVPSRFIVACVNGHLDDFPYKWWVHQGDINKCSAMDRDDKLKIKFSSASGGLDSISIVCTACGATRTMEGSLGKDGLKGYKCHGHRPWIGRKREYNDPENCKAPMLGLQRGASNVYFTVTASALTIPPWSGRIQTEISEHWENIDKFMAQKPTGATLDLILKAEFSQLLHLGLCTISELKTEIDKRCIGVSENVEFSEKELMQQEYRALCVGEYDDPQFKAEKTRVPDTLLPYISDVVLIKRLREILALRGFRRIMPEKSEAEDETNSEIEMDREFTPLSKNLQKWLPAIELLGEGFFIRLDETMLKNWESRNIGIYKLMIERNEDNVIGRGKMSARYVLLHTLSHLLIRQLTIECGYSGASIKERIYSTYPNSEESMAGILLYTSSSDSDGSLGGLVRQGFPEQIENIVRNMLQEASWCSSDPLCIQSKAQGFQSLNYAACHACALLPETSCEARNCLLDRAAVIGRFDCPSAGYFSELLGKI